MKSNTGHQSQSKSLKGSHNSSLPEDSAGDTGPRTSTFESWCVSWAPAVVPDGVQDGQAALGANGAEQGQALEVGEGQHSGEAVGDGAGDRVEGSEECLQEIAVWKVRDRKPAPPGWGCRGEGFPVHTEAQEPGHNGVSCQDQGRGQQGQGRDLHV